MKKHKMYVVITDGGDIPFLHWKYIEPPTKGKWQGGYSGSIPIKDITLDDAVSQMIDMIVDHPVPLPSKFDFEIGYCREQPYLQEGIKHWQELEKQGYPRISKGQKEKLMGLIKKYYSPEIGEKK